MGENKNIAVTSVEETEKSAEMLQKIESIKNKLIEKGKRNGFITYKEVLRSFEKLDINPEFIDDFYKQAEDNDLEILGFQDDMIPEKVEEGDEAETKEETDFFVSQSDDDILKAIEKLDVISEKYKVRFILSVSKDKSALPECAKAKVVVAL